jgi:GNAT superfamily N-acetyltransferase
VQIRRDHVHELVEDHRPVLVVGPDVVGHHRDDDAGDGACDEVALGSGHAGDALLDDGGGELLEQRAQRPAVIDGVDRTAREHRERTRVLPEEPADHRDHLLDHRRRRRVGVVDDHRRQELAQALLAALHDRVRDRVLVGEPVVQPTHGDASLRGHVDRRCLGHAPLVEEPLGGVEDEVQRLGRSSLSGRRARRQVHGRKV